MKILHICTQDYGGAGIAAHRLHLGLKAINVQSKILVLHCSSSDSDITKLTQNNHIFRRQWVKVRRRRISSEFDSYKNTRPKGLEMFSDDRSVYDISKHTLVKEADIIHLHWIAGMVNYIEFFPKVIDKHIVWTLHDMNPFTGGCHYAGDCVKYRGNCHACPQLGSTSLNDLSKRIWDRKEKCYKGQSIHVVTPSKWLADCARQSQLFRKFQVDVIANGLSTYTFSEREKQYSRELLGLPKDKILILFGAQSVNNPRKGASYLVNALKLLYSEVSNSNVALVTFGKCSSNFLNDVGFPIHSLGFIKDELLLSVCYSAAHIFVIPSLEESFGQTCLESMACGTPVVGFDIGGIPDIVRPVETGLLAQTRNAEQLAEQIKWMIYHSKERKQMGLNARKVIEQEYTLEIQAKRYQELYSSLSET